MIEPGAILGGKFRIERVLGRGGMGVVAIATHLQLDQKIAIKFLHEALAADEELVGRFLREARASVRLKSDHVCKVTDVGEIDGAPYIGMELLEGSDLAKVLAYEPLAVATAVEYVLQAAIAIAEAHAAGIVHRDLKPANLFLTKRLDGTALVKVLDFGIAKAPTITDLAITSTDVVMGSPGYMSPEQLRSARDVDARTDIWALGVILYQLVSGRLPFPAGSITELAVKITVDPPAPLEIDPAFRAVVFRCLEKVPADRYGDVAALAAALAPFGPPSAQQHASLIGKLVRPEAFTTTLPAAIAVRATTADDTTLQGAAGAKVTRQRSRLLTPIAVAGLVAVATAVVFVATRHGAAHLDVVAGDDLRAANSALTASRYAEALDGARRVLAGDASNGRALEVATAAACHLDKRDEARAFAARISSDARFDLGRTDCDRIDIEPAGSANALARDAGDAARAGDHAAALSKAEAGLALEPKNLRALDAATRASCRLHDLDRVHRYYPQLSASRKAPVKVVCENAGIEPDKP